MQKRVFPTSGWVPWQSLDAMVIGDCGDGGDEGGDDSDGDGDHGGDDNLAHFRVCVKM